MFSNIFLRHTHEKKTNFLFCFLIRDSRVIIHNGLPSLESADAV